MQATLTSWGQLIGSWLQAQATPALAWLAIALGATLAGLLLVVLLLASRVKRWRRSAAQLELQCQEQGAGLLNQQQQCELLEQRITALREVETGLAAAERENTLLTHSSAELSGELTRLRAQLEQLRSSHAALQAQTRAERVALEEKLELLQQNRAQLAAEFELLANRIFDEKTQKFSKNSQQLLDVTLSPLKNQLDDFRQRVDHVYTVESKERHVLQEQIKQLRAESLRISEDASNLTRALKADNKSQGNWGELTLVRALEMCGLKEPEEYETQVAYKAEDNSRQIPDVVVHLPGGKDIIIDSKVSLVAYTRYFEADSDAARAQAIEQHLQSVRQHIKQLSDKSYQNLPGVTTLDYVMLYIPVEGASTMALQAARDLWEEAYARNIVLVSPTNLLAILRSVETIWRHEKQNKNAEEIARQAGNLHDKFVGLISSLETVGRSLDAATSAYQKAYGQLSTGKGNLVSRVQTLEKLGAKTKQPMPRHLRETSMLDSDVTADEPAVTPGETTIAEQDSLATSLDE
ncbi:MAG: DNA recombination protein RmuC [Gammaproteobacteria bacterium]|nr:DNA recombination protein RmuC [Gammaproteobacteria bacterium]